MKRPITPRIKIVEDLKECVGKSVSTNLSPTLRAKLIRFNRDLSLFEISEADEDGPTKYNSAAGKTFEIPTQMALTLKFF
jgi:hypothetical protein